jgi:uncharacterized membrane protein YbaN (DUF454 family)
MSRFSVQQLWVWIGWILVGLGVVGNEWVLTIILSPDGTVEIQNRVAVWLLALLCIASGLCFVKMRIWLLSRDVLRRLSQSYPTTLAVSIGFVLTVLMLGCAEGIFYGLDRYEENGKETVVEKASWIMMSPPEEARGVGEHPSQRVQGRAIADPFLGHKLPNHVQITDTMQRGAQPIYAIMYTTQLAHDLGLFDGYSKQ